MKIKQEKENHHHHHFGVRAVLDPVLRLDLWSWTDGNYSLGIPGSAVFSAIKWAQVPQD